MSARRRDGRALDIYVRKIGPDRFEYGVVERSNNFRKHPDKFIASGVEATVAAAEAARAAISFSSSPAGK